MCALVTGVQTCALPIYVDSFAVESHQRAAKAWANGYFARSVVPVVDRNGLLVLDHDEQIRPGTTVESLAGLAPSFAALGEAGFSSEERRGGTECVSTCRSRGSPYPLKQKKNITT